MGTPAYSETEAARNGAKYLDFAKPGWFREIDMDDLQMSNGRMCIIGQCFGGFYRGLNKLAGLGDDCLNSTLTGPQQKFTEDFGFNVPSRAQKRGGYEHLGIAWKREIRKRLRKAGVR